MHVCAMYVCVRCYGTVMYYLFLHMFAHRLHVLYRLQPAGHL